MATPVPINASVTRSSPTSASARPTVMIAPIAACAIVTRVPPTARAAVVATRIASAIEP
jgi:hypothetical protein